MASHSMHTEPSGPHSYDELMKPGRHHHNTNALGDMACPDPSVHRDTKLQEQASSAALYATSPGKKMDPREGLLDKDGKLSSRSKFFRDNDMCVQDLTNLA